MILLLSACAPDPEVVIEIDGSATVATVDARFLSFAVDSAQLVGGVFWNPDETADEEEIAVAPFDFSQPLLATLTEALPPATLRIGGTAADLIYYDLDGTGEIPTDDALIMTAAQWEGVMDFAAALDLTVLFTLNAGPGPRDDEGTFDPANSVALMEHAAQRGDPVVVWELGNEINGYGLLHGLSLSPEQYAADLAVVAAERDRIDPEVALAGPSSAFWPVTGEFNGFYEDLMPLGGSSLDVVTWHYYPQQSERCPVASRPAGPEVMLQPENLDEVAVWAEVVESAAAAHSPEAEVWLGETGNAQCGGAPGVSDAYAGGFWWLDQLGTLAARGQQQVVRQTLSGSDYGLLDDDGTLTPLPDYYTSVLWGQIMGSTVLSAQTTDPLLRTYAHCHPEGNGAVGVVVINLDTQDRVVGTSLPGGVALYSLTAESLESREMLLNGDLLVLKDGALPPMVAVEERSGVVTIPAQSYALLAYRDAEASACY